MGTDGQADYKMLPNFNFIQSWEHKSGHIHVYSHRIGTDNPLESIFSKNINLLSVKSFYASVSPLNDS